MDLQEIQKRQSYLNIELMNNYRLAFDIALSKILIDDQEDFKKHFMFMEATSSKHPKHPNTLLFKHNETREHWRIGYELLDCI